MVERAPLGEHGGGGEQRRARSPAGPWWWRYGTGRACVAPRTPSAARPIAGEEGGRRVDDRDRTRTARPSRAVRGSRSGARGRSRIRPVAPGRRSNRPGCAGGSPPQRGPAPRTPPPARRPRSRTRARLATRRSGRAPARCTGPTGGWSRYWGVALGECGERVGSVAQDRDLADRLDPGQPRPVLLVVVDGERGAGPGGQPAHAGEAVGRDRLGLVVDRSDQRAGAQRVRDRQHARAALVVEEAEPSHARVLE